MKVYCIYRVENGTFTISGNAPGETNYPSSFDAPGTRQIVGLNGNRNPIFAGKACVQTKENE